MQLYLVFSFIQHFLNSLLQNGAKTWLVKKKPEEVNILQHICYCVLRQHSPRLTFENIWAFQAWTIHGLCSHKVKDTSLFWELEDFFLFVSLVKELDGCLQHLVKEMLDKEPCGKPKSIWQQKHSGNLYDYMHCEFKADTMKTCV